MKSTLTISSLLLIVSSADAQTFSDHDAAVDFKSYTTYAWIAPGDSVLNRLRPDKPFAGSIMYFANLELKRRGMSVDTLNPQALFIFSTTVVDEKYYTQTAQLSVGVAVAGPGYYVGGSAPVAGGKIVENSYLKGSLVFDMYDTNSGKLLWRGGTKRDFHNADDISKLIEESERKIFKKFPKKVVK